MASFGVPCRKISLVLAPSPQTSHKGNPFACFPQPDSRSSHALIASAQLHAYLFPGCGRSQSNVFKVAGIAVEKISNADVAIKKVSAIESEKQNEVPDASSISTFMAQVVKLVDSRDIVELELKQMDCEVFIRKKEALPQPSVEAPIVFTQPPMYHNMQRQIPPASVPQMPPASVPHVSVPSSPASAPSPSAPAKPKSLHPPFKCPMAGTFYRSHAPGAPPFVKVGDKVQKGQADQSGTVVEVLADDGKPVSVDTPLFTIEP